GTRASFDARFATPLDEQKLIYGSVNTPINDSNDRVVVPGDLLHSVLHNRDNRVGPLQMPPLAKNVVDSNAVQVIRDWITALPPGPGVVLQTSNLLVSG